MKINKNREEIISDLLRPVGLTRGFHIWMAALSILLFICLYAYTIQLRDGLGVTGLRDYASWGMYISNFVFFVASSLIGMLISGVLGLTGQKWITPITRMAEIIAVAFSAVAGLVIVSDMGRPDRLPFVFLYGRFQSPILWDVTVITAYMILSLLLLYVTALPDLALCRDRLKEQPSLLQKVYKIISLGWREKEEQYKLMHKAARILILLIIPMALAIHTVTSWLFAVTLRPEWDSTIFGPYFVSGAFVAGSGALIIAMYFFRINYKLKDYITPKHFNKMGKLLAVVTFVYLYFNINEYFIPTYKMKLHDIDHLHSLYSGRWSILFWSVQVLGLLIPMILTLLKPMRKPIPLTIIAIFIMVGAWLKRLLIVVPTQEHPFLPIHPALPSAFKFYSPTLIETGITLASFIMVIMIITVLSKLLPIIPVMETVKENEEQN